MRIVGSRVLVTGAGQGLGLAIASAFANRGAKLVITDIDAGRIESAVAALRASGGVASGYRMDVTNPKEVAEVRSRISAEHGPVDILINNAGVVFGGPFHEVALERHLATVNINLAGVLAVTHAFLADLMKRPAAHVVNIASAAAVIALPLAASYAATKWAVLGFSDSLREEFRELGHRHVAVSAICPGYITTGLFDGAKPARFTGWLSANTVADAVVRAVERDREFVMLPWSAWALYRLCAGWPRSWYRAVCRRLGVSRSMVNWRGRQPETPIIGTDRPIE